MNLCCDADHYNRILSEQIDDDRGMPSTLVAIKRRKIIDPINLTDFKVVWHWNVVQNMR